MIARDIMTHRVYTTTPQATVQEVAQLLTRERISGVPVVNPAGKLIGIVTEADIIAKTTASNLHVKDIMSSEVIVVDDDTPVSEIAQLLTTKRIKRVPVVHEGQLVGIVSRADIVYAVAQGHLTIRQW